MKNVFLLALILFFSKSNAQIDSLSLKKESRLKVVGSVLKNSILSVPGDFSEMGHEITSDWKKTAIYTTGILGLIATDKITTGFLHDKIEPAIDYSLPRFDVIKTKIEWLDGNNAYILYPIIGLYAGSVALNNKKGQTVAVNSFKSVAYSYVISHLLLKSVFARNRPQRPLNDDTSGLAPWTKDNWDFGNFHPVYFEAQVEGTAFPSFHATFYFSVAKVFQMEYNNYWIPYTIATGVFLADIKSHNHWVSDLLVGGLIGTIIGRAVVNSSRKQANSNNNHVGMNNFKKFKMQKQLIPQISSAMVGLHFVGSF